MADPKAMKFIDHLDELRGSILRIVGYLVAGMAISWGFRVQIMDALSYPAREGALRAGLEQFSFHIFEPVGGIILMLQLSLLGAVVIAFPLICLELWWFIKPGLRPVEQRYIYVLLPAAVVLFAAGIAFCYVIAPAALGYLLIFNTQLGVQAQLTVGAYLRFFMRILVVFGLAFETPLVMMFLARIGLITSDGLLRTWRMAIVIIAIIAAMVTPTPDPFNMSLVGVPMLLLYFLSVGLTVIAERARGNPPGKDSPQSGDSEGEKEKRTDPDLEAAGEDNSTENDDRP